VRQRRNWFATDDDCRLAMFFGKLRAVLFPLRYLAMPRSAAENAAASTLPRKRCYDCFRPLEDCYCAALPQIDNRTEVLILQHLRERFHPFNTARMVHRSLRNSRMLVDYTGNLAAATLPLRPKAGLLYPSADARLLDGLSPDERPEQLVILDGTWHHAKTLVRDIAALHELPRFRLAPSDPGNYRIRLEPTETSLSTVEATVAALRALEPETPGFEQLLLAFQQMVERQLAHPCAEYDRASRAPQRQAVRNIPRVLIEDLAHVVVVYGEANPGERGQRRLPSPPIYWVAQRLGTGDCFTCAIQPQLPLGDTHLALFDLSESDFSAALSPEEACAGWARFQRPSDRYAVYNQGTADLLQSLCTERVECQVLKAVNFHPHRHYRTLDELIAGEGLLCPSPLHSGRAGKRLANAVALVHYLHALGVEARALG
jgi:DTW domain-containing protein YfiP